MFLEGGSEQEMRLLNKVALITGAGSGIGEAIAKLFSQEGAQIIASDIDAAALDRVVMEINQGGGTAIGIRADISKADEVNNLVDSGVKAFGKLDILVNNAGIMDNFVPVADLDEELWDKVLGVNLKGSFLTSKAALKLMLAQKKGVIINVSSVGGLFGVRGGAAYVVSKHGLIGLTKNIAAVYHDQGIRCVAIAPGGVRTNIGKTINNPHQLGLEKLNKGVGPAPMGEPEQIAALAAFLAADEASFVNGAVVVADGGWTAY